MRRRSLLKILCISPTISFVDIAKADKKAAIKSTSDMRKMVSGPAHWKVDRKFLDEFEAQRVLTKSEYMLNEDGDTVGISRPNVFTS